MNKQHILVGILLIAAGFVGGMSLTRSPGIASEESNLAATVAPNAQSQSVVVTYTDKGFIPDVVTVPRGASIDFLNRSGKALRIAPIKDPKDGTSAYLGFEASKSTTYGETFGVSVTQPGIWGYKNLNEPTTVGVVIVE